MKALELKDDSTVRIKIQLLVNRERVKYSLQKWRSVRTLYWEFLHMCHASREHYQMG